MSAAVLDVANALGFNVGFAVLEFAFVWWVLSRVLEGSDNRGTAALVVVLLVLSASGLVVSVVVSFLAAADLLAKLGGA